MRSLLAAFARRHGYAIGKYPATDFAAIPAFHVLVHLLMTVRGPTLNVIQVGANDGRGFGDPLNRYFRVHPWRGVLVEPQADVCEVLRNNYSNAPGRLAFENVAITSRGARMTMYRQRGCSTVGQSEATYASSVVSADPVVIAQQLGIGKAEVESFDVPCMTLDALMEKHALHEVDILQVDTEGHEREVLETIELSKRKPRLIQFEHGHMKPHDITAVFQRLGGYGYRLLYGGRQIDSLACHESALAEMGVE
jgi:FkbM family methyltransferase